MIEHGHDKAQLPAYTRRQLLFYYDKALRREKDARANLICDICAAQGKNPAEAVARLRGHNG